MIYLKVSSASQEIPLGYFVSGTDGNTELTSLTIANTDIKLWKNGATTLVNKNSGGATHMSAGVYVAVLDAIDTATLGSLNIYCHPAGALPCKTDCVVLSANIFDSFIGATSTLIVGSVTGAVASVTGNVGGSVLGSVSYVAGAVVGNVSGSIGSVAAGGITATSIATGAIDADSLAADAGAEIATAVWAAASRTLSGDQSFTLIGNLSGNVNGSVGSVTNGATLAQINSLVSGIRGSDNDDLKVLSDQLDGVSVSGSTPAAIWSYATRTLSGDQSFTLIGNISGNLTGSVGSVTAVSDKTGYSLAATQTFTMIGNVSGNVNGSVGSVVNGATLAQINSLVSGIRGTDNDSLKNISDEIAGISVSGGASASEVWSYSSRTLSGDQTFTLIGNISGNVNGSVGSVTSTVSSNVVSMANNVITDAAIASDAEYTLAQIGGAVWDIQRSEHTSTGSFGEYVNVSGATAAQIWSYSPRTLSGDQTFTIIGNLSGNVNGSVGSVTNGATLTQINSLVSGIRGSDNDDLKALSDQLDGISVSGSTPQAIWEYSSRTLSGTQSFTLIGNISGNVNGSVGSVAGAVASVTGNVGGSVLGSVSYVAGSIIGNVSGSIGSVAAGGITATSIAAGAIDADALAADAGAEIATSVWAAASRTLSGTQSFTLIGNLSGNVNGSVGSVTTVSDKTGYSLAATQTYTLIGNLSGNVNGSVGSIGTGGITATSIATGAIDADSLAADAGTEIATAVWASSARSLSGNQSFTLIGNLSGNVNGSVGSVTGNVGGSVASVVGAVGSVVGNVSGSVASVTGNVAGSVASVVGAVGSVAGNVSGSVASVANGATLAQINSLVSGIRGSDNDSLKNISDEIAGISVSGGATASEIWSYATRTLSGDQSFTLIGNVSGTVASVVNGATLTQINSLVSSIRGADNDDLKTLSDQLDSVSVSGSTPQAIWEYSARTLSGTQTFTLIGNISGSVGSVVNGATLTQINSLVSGIRGSDNDDLKTLSDQLDSVSVSGSTPSAIWSYANRTLSGDQSFTLIGNVSGSVASVTNGATLTQINSLVSGIRGTDNDSLKNISDEIAAKSSGATPTEIWSYSSRSLSGTQTFNIIGNLSGSVASVTGNILGSVSYVAGSVLGNVSGSVGSVANGATLTQINTLVSGIRGADNDDLKVLSDQISAISTSGASASEIWSYATRTITGGTITTVSGDQTFNLIGNISGNVLGDILGSVSYVAGSVLGNVLGSVGSVSGALTLGDIIDGIWDEPVADHTTTATTGKALTSTGTATVNPADIWSYATRTLTSSGTASIDYTQVENAVWNAQRSSHVSSGTFGEGVNVSGAITLGTIVDGIWDEALSGHSTSGTAGHQLASTVTSSGTVYLNIGEAEIADAVWNAQTSDYIATGSMGRALTSTGTAVIDASDVWNYASRTLTSTGVSDATLANQEIIIQHLVDIKGDDWTDEDLVAIMTAIENGTWGGFGI